MKLSHVQDFVCIIDGLVAPGYILMTTICLASSLFPIGIELSSHGKTRSNPPSLHDDGPSSRLSAFLNSQRFLIPKKQFRHFYWFGFFWTMVVLLCFGRSDQGNPLWLPASTLLLLCQLLHRLWECLCVHRWRECSRIHVAGYMVGMVYYLWLPLVFIEIPCEPWKGWSLGAWLEQGQVMSLLTEATRPATKTDRAHWFTPIWAILCIYFQYEQYKHHAILAASCPRSAETTYTLPQHRWFRFIVCPHYLAEICIYAFLILTFVFEHGVLSSRCVALFLWIVSNLTVSARMNLKWYRHNLPRKLVEDKKAIFPGLL